MKSVCVLLQYMVPQRTLSRFIGFLVNCRLRWLKNRMISWFVKRYAVDMRMAEEQNLLNYKTFNDFFTRKLKEGIRPIDERRDTIISPVDGVISQRGEIKEGLLLQAKGLNYNLNALLAGQYVKDFENGHFMTLYLSPKEYHRVHIPYTGILRQMCYVPGQLFSVNSETTSMVPNLFTRNERVVCFFETSVGLMAVVMIGALLVGSIHTVWAGKVTPQKDRKMFHVDYREASIELVRGSEMGHFEMGSTVIVLFQSNKIVLDQGLNETQFIQMGQRLAESVFSSRQHEEPHGNRTEIYY